MKGGKEMSEEKLLKIEKEIKNILEKSELSYGEVSSILKKIQNQYVGQMVNLSNSINISELKNQDSVFIK